MAMRRQLAVGSIWTAGVRAGVSLMGLANTIILARLLTPGDFGLVAVAAGGVGADFERFAVMGEERDLHVLDHGHRGIGGGDLEGAAHALPPDLAGGEAGDILPV